MKAGSAVRATRSPAAAAAAPPRRCRRAARPRRRRRGPRTWRAASRRSRPGGRRYARRDAARRGSTTIGRRMLARGDDRADAGMGDDEPRAADRLGIGRPVELAHPGHVPGLVVAGADLGEDLLARALGRGPGVHRPDHPVEGEHRADGDEDHRRRSGRTAAAEGHGVTAPLPSTRARRASRGGATARARRRRRAGRGGRRASSPRYGRRCRSRRCGSGRGAWRGARATKPGAAPVVTTTSGRSARTMAWSWRTVESEGEAALPR